MGNFIHTSHEMMNKLVLLPLFLFCLYGNKKNDNVNKKKTDIEKDGLNGKVKQVKLDCFDADEKSGNPIQEKRCDDNNYLVVYNDKGNRIELSVHSSGWRDEKRLFKYDNNEKLIELNVFDANNNLSGKFTYYYDINGNKIVSKFYGTDNILKNRQTYKYDDKGNAIEQNEYNSKDILVLKHVYKYDGEGNQIESNTYASMGSLEDRNIDKFDDKGNRIETNSYNANGNLENKGIWTYDEKNNPIQENWYDKNGILNSEHTYNYIYDHQSNWIKKIEFEKTVPKKIILREITYFP
jgi:hypothetical protein